MKMMVLRRDESSDPIAFVTKVEHAKTIAARMQMEKFEIVPVEVTYSDAPPLMSAALPAK